MKKIIMLIFLINIYVLLFSVRILIPEQQPDIQTGINISADGDTILVSNGTYYENIDFNGKNITVCSLFFITQNENYIVQTIINGGHNGSVVTFQNNENQNAILCGFTITNGYTNVGGGINCLGTDPQIRDCIINENEATLNGGGINFEDSYASVENVSILENNSGFEGGGISSYSSNIHLTNVQISDNNGGNYGGGIISNSSNLILNRIIIAGNSASYRGGGMQCESNSSPELSNVTIFGNYANNGDGIYCNEGSVPEIENCILWNNGIEEINGTVLISYSDIQGEFTGTGNINSDPLFVDSTTGNFHLTNSSPCIDAGNPTSPFDPDNTISDMGALYFDQNDSTYNPEISFTDLKLNIYPNPFNPSTTISFVYNREIADGGKVNIEIYNLKGQKIDKLRVMNYELGKNEIVWNAENFGSGIYFAKLQVNDKFVASQKMLLLK